MKKFLAINLSDVAFIMLIIVKMQTIVGILTFMSRKNFVLGCVEPGKFITTGPNPLAQGKISYNHLINTYMHSSFEMNNFNC